MQANLDSTVEILEENRHCYHLEVQSRAVDPRRPLDPIIKKRILCLRPIDYKKYFQCSTPDQIEYLKAMNLRDCRLVHDPSIERVERIAPIKSEEELKKIDDRKTVTSPLLKRKPKAK